MSVTAIVDPELQELARAYTGEVIRRTLDAAGVTEHSERVRIGAEVQARLGFDTDDEAGR